MAAKGQVTMEEHFEAACKAKQIGGAAIVATNKSGSFSYRNAFGVRSFEDDAEPMTEDSIMWIASCTKLVTSIAVMQCVERGLVTLDEDVRPIIPGFFELEILEGDEAGNITSRRKNTTPITLRHLLSHTSGFSYAFLSPLLETWWREKGEDPTVGNRRQRFLMPLVHEPGTSWIYGPSLDWAGAVVERVTKSESLSAYMEENIWRPLGIKDMTFSLGSRPDLQARRVVMAGRDETPVVSRLESQPAFEPDREDCFGGEGIFTSAEEFLKVLQALLRATDAQASDDASPPAQQLLRRSTARSMFEPALDEKSRAPFTAATDKLRQMISDMPPGISKDFAFGGFLLQDDLPNWRKKGTLTWGGAANWSWWIDPESDLCGVFASQLLPMGDAKTNELLHAFERAMYERSAASKSAAQS